MPIYLLTVRTRHNLQQVLWQHSCPSHEGHRAKVIDFDLEGSRRRYYIIAPRSADVDSFWWVLTLIIAQSSSSSLLFDFLGTLPLLLLFFYAFCVVFCLFLLIKALLCRLFLVTHLVLGIETCFMVTITAHPGYSDTNLFYFFHIMQDQRMGGCKVATDSPPSHALCDCDTRHRSGNKVDWCIFESFQLCMLVKEGIRLYWALILGNFNFPRRNETFHSLNRSVW